MLSEQTDDGRSFGGGKKYKNTDENADIYLHSSRTRESQAKQNET